MIAILSFNPASAQNIKGTITGSVITDKNKPADNASVMLKGTSYGTIANEAGSFHFKAPAGSYTLTVTFVGAKSQEIPVIVKAGEAVQVPLITLSVTTGTLQQVTINASKANKYATKNSDYVDKMPLANLENAQVYSTVSKELLQEQGLFTADAAIQNVPGLSQLWTATNRVGDGGSYFTLRGFPVQTELRNGLSGNVASTIDAANLESLEVIKGPEGTLYGSSLVSFGGLINRVTKKPFDTEDGEVTYSTGSYNFNRVSIDYNTPIDTAKKMLFRINSAYTNSGSFQDNGKTNSFVFDPSFKYTVNDRLTLSFDLEISHVAAPTPSIYYFGATAAQLGATNANQLSINYKDSYQGGDLTTTSNVANFFAMAEYKISDNWKSQTNISTTSNNGGGYGPFFYLEPNNHIARDVWDVTGGSNTLQIQQNFVGDFKIGNLRNRLVAGLDFLNQQEDIKYINPSGGSDAFDVINTRGAIPNYYNFNKSKVDSLFTNTTLSTFYSRYNTYTYSAYASDVLNITDNLLAMASLRVDNYDTKPITDPTSGTVLAKAFNQTTLSPKFGLVYKLFNNQLSLFGNYTNGFINPGYGEVHTPNTTNGLTETLFKTEEANQLEGGIKWNAFNGRLNGTVSYYDIKVSNEVIGDPAHANASIQAGTQTSKGIEAQLNANPFTGFNILAGFSHNNSLMTNASAYDNGLRPETAGPPNQANLWLSYTITSGDVRGLGIGFGGNYAGNNYVINDTYNGKFFLPSYTLLNTGVFYNKERYRLALNVNNLTNKEYYTGYTTVNPQMLRQILGSVTFKF
ncbi:TonB-dependent receptor domain-containing protein [Mucilaginibacter sp.]